MFRCGKVYLNDAAEHSLAWIGALSALCCEI